MLRSIRKMWTWIDSGGATGLLAVLLLALILALQYLAGIFTILISKNSKEIELAGHLRDLGTLATPILEKTSLAIADLAFDAQWQENQSAEATSQTTALQIYRKELEADLTQPLESYVRWARLHSLILITDDGRVLYDTLHPERALQRYDFWEIDRAEIARALDGQPAVTPFYTAPEGLPIKRYYQPLTDPAGSGAGQVRALLCLVAGQNYLQGISQLGRSLFRLNLLLTVLMGGVGLLIYSLIRRQRRYERQAAEADRLAGLGTLAAGFAHELRNPLEIIRAFTEDLERSVRLGAHPEEAIEACQEIIEEVDRMNRLVGQFLSYSRGHAENAIEGTTPLLETASSVLAMLRPSAEKAGLTLRLEHPGAEEGVARRWTAALDAGAFRQVLLNLTLNAIQASRRGGAVTVTLGAAARQVELKVQDQGAGIPEKDRHRIFEPFFSTRAQGSGLGLAISRRIAEQAGGSLKLGPAAAGQGACFALALPRARETDGTGKTNLNHG